MAQFKQDQKSICLSFTTTKVFQNITGKKSTAANFLAAFPTYLFCCIWNSVFICDVDDELES